MTDLSYSIARADELSRRTLVLLYPDVIDPLYVDEIASEDLDEVDNWAAGSQAEFEDEAARTKKVHPTVTARVSDYFSKAGAWLDKHPSFKKGLYASAFTGILLASIFSPMLGFAGMAVAEDANHNVGIDGFITESHNATADNYINASEQTVLKNDTTAIYCDLQNISNELNSNSDFNGLLEQILAQSVEAKDIAKYKQDPAKAYQVFDTLNRTIEALDNTTIEQQKTIAQLNFNDSAFAMRYNWMLENITKFKEIFNATKNIYDPLLGNSYCYNLLNSFEGQARSIIKARDLAKDELPDVMKDVVLIGNYLAEDITTLRENAKYKSIDGKTFKTPGGALNQSLIKLINDMEKSNVKKKTAPKEDDNPIAAVLFSTVLTLLALRWSLRNKDDD
jgi:hypothetical protein